MSLRGRLITLIALVLLISVIAYAIAAWGGARHDLKVELGAARRGGLQTALSDFEDLPRSVHPERDLRQLVATFNGNRHLVASVVDRDGKVLLRSAAELPERGAPRWFAASVSPVVESTSLLVPDGKGERLILQPEPASDIAALWSAMLSAAAFFAVAVVFGLALVYWVIGRGLAPLNDLARGLEKIGTGAYGERVREAGSPELLSLQRGFNTMAERLAETDARNRALEAQLLTIQDEERAEIARDLHDEIGPHLFAVALDAEMIGRALSDGETKPVAEQVRSIQSAVSYMQRQVRELIARLRPTRAAELGLEAALTDLVSFWQSRQPGLEISTQLDDADTFVPEPLRDVIYRVVQESVANALRHADTSKIAIVVTRLATGVQVQVDNRGPSKPVAEKPPGLGLVSMRERVTAVGGVLDVRRANEGWSVAARFGRASDGMGIT